MFIGICSRSQVSVYRTIGPLVCFHRPSEKMPEYPLNVYTSTYRGDMVEKLNTLADLGSSKNWEELLEFLDAHKSFINCCRLPVDSDSPPDLCTPLHYAAKGSAPKDVFEKLVKLGASKTLKDSDGKTVFDIGKSNGLGEDILKLIEVPKEIVEKESEILKLQSGLHKCILGRAENLIQRNGQQLPQVAYLYEFGDFWYPIPGMYGGFNVSRHADGIQAESWCRVAGGSGQRHVIDREGNVELVDEGFV